MSEPQLIRCPSCGATNRVPLEKIAQGLQPVCGRCKTALLVDNKPVTVTDATFAAEVDALAAAGAARHVGAVVRALPDGSAGD